MAEILKICDCGNECRAEVGQSFISGKLTWYLSYKCMSCGKATEIDGSGDIPVEVRQAILEKDGTWGLVIDNSNNISSVLKTLRKELNLSLQEVTKLKKLIPGIVLKGTKIEMARLKEVLYINNVMTSVSEL